MFNRNNVYHDNPLNLAYWPKMFPRFWVYFLVICTVSRCNILSGNWANLEVMLSGALSSAMINSKFRIHHPGTMNICTKWSCRYWEKVESLTFWWCSTLPLTSVLTLIVIHTIIVEICQSGPKWGTKKPNNMAVLLTGSKDGRTDSSVRVKPTKLH